MNYYVEATLKRAQRVVESQNARARALGEPGRVSLEEWVEIILTSKGRCSYCGSDGATLMEHMIPLSRGGSHTAGNVVVACGGCDAKKRDSLPDEYIARYHPFCRLEAEGSQKALAEKLEVSEQYLSDVLNKRKAAGDKILSGLRLRRVTNYVPTKEKQR